MKYMLHIALLASTLTAHHSAQTAVKTPTVSRAFARPSARVIARAAFRSGTRSASLTEQDLDKLGAQEGVPLNVEQLELAQTVKPATALNLGAQDVVSDRVITRSRTQALHAKEDRKMVQRAKNHVRAMAKKVAKSRKN